MFHSLFGVDYMIAMIVSALVIVGYTILGGFRAVTTTDLIQSVVMSIALVAVLAYGIGVAGGWGAVMENAHSLSGYLTMAASHNAAAGTAASYSLLDIVSTMAWGLGYFGMFWSCLCMDMGALTAFFYGFRDREKVLDIMEETTGGRLIQNYNVIGGVMADIHPNLINRIKEFIKYLPPMIKEYHDVFTGNVIAQQRLKGVGVLRKEDAISYGP